jgi:hypothetical protein
MKVYRLHFFFSLHAVAKTPAVKKILQCSCFILCAALLKAQEVNMYTGCNMVLDGNVYVVLNNTAFKNNGSFTAGTSTVKFTGDTDTTVAYIAGSSNTVFNNLTLGKTLYGIAIKSRAAVKNVLTLSAGKLYADSNLTLLSDINNTARLAAVPAGAFIYGKAMVERYIPSRRAWRLMTAPVTNASSIYNSWQNAGVYTAGKGLLVSGAIAANGIDMARPSSLKTWDVTNQAYAAVTNTYNSISATSNGSADNTGYFLFIRGDRDPNNFNIPNTNITTLTSIGALQTGTQTFTAAPIAGRYTLIGNPYASPIDFNMVTRNNLLKRFYVWDPSLNALGGYVIMDDIDNDGTYSKSLSASTQTKDIQSSQAFFVETTAGGAASLVINESAKSTTNNNGVFRPVGNAGLSGISASLRANLYLLNTDNSTVLADGALAEFGDGFTDTATNEDAIKFSNINESIGFTRYGTTLGIERRPVIKNTDTLFLKIWRTTQRSYQLQLVTENINRPGLTAYIEDSYLAGSRNISLLGTDTINFQVDGNAASAADNRFKIVFKQAAVLPVVFTSVKAYKVNKNIQVEWKVADEKDVLKYEVEKSANGTDFSIVNTTAPNQSGAYTWIDETTFEGENFFRIKSTGRNGAVKYSQIVNVMMEREVIPFTILPNPVTGKTIHLHFANQPAGNYRFSLINSAGQLIKRISLPVNSSTTALALTINGAVTPGAYQLQIAGPQNNTQIQKLIIQQ